MREGITRHGARLAAAHDERNAENGARSASPAVRATALPSLDRRAWLKRIAGWSALAAWPAFAAQTGGGVAATSAQSTQSTQSTQAAPAAPRVASLSWAGAQILVSLGVVPTGLAERADYPLSGALPAMPASVRELGLHSEPNLELLQQLRPDLIVIDDNQSALAPRLREIAPTFTLDLYDPQRGTPYVRATEETLRLAALLGRDAAAHRYLAQANAQLDACATSLRSLATRSPVLVVDLYDDGRHLYLYGPNSMMQDVMDHLGVRNAWRGSTDSGYLLSGIEALASMGDAMLFYISHGVQDRVALHQLGRSALWQHLPFVEAGRVRPLPGFFAYGATACAVQFAQALTAGIFELAGRDGHTHG